MLFLLHEVHVKQTITIEVANHLMMQFQNMRISLNDLAANPEVPEVHQIDS